MRIIKRGTPKAKDLFRGTCRECRSQIECERAELHNIQWDQRESGELAQVPCPVCCESMWVYPFKGTT